MKINKSDKGAGGFLKHAAFHLHRGKGHLIRYLWNRVRWHVYPRLRLAGSYPDHVDIELSSICNMKCPMCYTLTERFRQSVPRCIMDISLFRKIVDELAEEGVFSIRLSWRGEPLVHPDFMECVRYARTKGVKEISSLTNGLKLTVDMFEELVHLQMDWLTISFDGTGSTYESIRMPAKYPEMLAKLTRFHDIRERTHSVKPVVRIQGVWPAIAENPGEFFRVFDPIADEVSVNSLLDYLHKDLEIDYLEDFVCPVPFQRLVIGSDGRAFMCINDEYGVETVGDAHEQTIRQIWNGPAMKRIRTLHRNREALSTLGPCNACYQPRKTKRVPYDAGDRIIWLDELVGRPQVVGK